MIGDRQREPIGLFEIAILFIVLTSFACVALIWLRSFHGLTALVAGSALTTLATGLVVRSRGFALRDGRFHWELWPILALALVFRVQPSVYMTGGQDQGVYMVLSSYLERVGHPFVHDRLRDQFVAEGLKGYYDSTNEGKWELWFPGAYEGTHRPGIHVASFEKSNYVFQFYHLHPAWMAIAAKVLGAKYRVLAVVAFGFLSLLSIYLLTGLLSPAPRAAAAVATLLLAVSPAHIFFSRFPLSEIMALALISTGLYYLLKGYRRSKASLSAKLELFLSWGAFSAYFFTRISGFLWLPFFYCLALLALFFEKDKDRRRALVAYALAVFGSYIVSVVDGLIFALPYSWDIYRSIIPRRILDHWKTILPVAASLAIGVPVLLSTIIRGQVKWEALARHVARAARYLVFSALIIVLLACGWLVWDLAVHSNSDEGRAFWFAGKTGWAAAKHACLWVDFVHLSPPVFFAFLIGIFQLLRSKAPEHGLLILALTVAWYYAGYKQEFIPYQYYALRYQIMELLPLTLITATLVLSAGLRHGGWKRRVALASIVWACASSLWYSVHQLKGSEMQGINSSLQNIAAAVERDDLLLMWHLDGRFADVATVLRYYHGLNAIFVRSPEDITDTLAPLLAGWPGRVLLLTAEDPAGAGAIPHSKEPTRFPMRMGRLETSSEVPRQYQVITGEWTLYEVDRRTLRSSVALYAGPRTDAPAPRQEPGHSKMIQLRGMGLQVVEGDGSQPLLSVSIDERCEMPLQARAKLLGHELSRMRALDGHRLSWQLPRDFRKVDQVTLEDIPSLEPSCIRSAEIDRMRTVIYPGLANKDFELEGFYPDGFWVNGQPRLNDLDIPADSYRWLVVRTHGSHPWLRSSPARIQSEAFVNGSSLGRGIVKGKSLWFKLPPSAQRIRNVAFRFNTFTPKKIGIGEDIRELGMDIQSIQIQ